MDGNTAAENDQSSGGTDYDSVGKYLKDTEEALFDRIFGIGGCVSDRSGTKTGFVGENSPGDAFFHAEKETSHHTTGDSGRRKCSFKDGLKNCRNTVKIQKNHAQSQYEIQKSHKGN